MNGYYEKTRQQLVSHYSGLLQDAKKKRSRSAMVFLVVFLTMAFIAFVVNLTFQLHGEPFIVLVPIFFVWFFMIHCVSQPRLSITEINWLVQALNGIPKEAAWHAWRIKRIMFDVDCPVNYNELTRWLLYDIDLFLKRYPKSEAIRFIRVELDVSFGWVGDAVEELDRIIEMNGFLREAYQYRAKLLEKIDPTAAKRDREKLIELEKEGYPISPKPSVDTVNPMDYAIVVEPVPPVVTMEDAQNLVNEGRFADALTVAVKMESLNDMIDVYTAVAKNLHEGNEKTQAAKVLADAIDVIFYETESKYQRGLHLTRVALVQGELYGSENARQTLDLAVSENSQARKEESRLSTFRAIVEVQLELALFDGAEQTIRIIGNKGYEEHLLLNLADKLLEHGNASKAETLRKAVDENIPTDEEAWECIGNLLRVAESYTKAGQRETARNRLRRAMDLVKYSENGFHDEMLDISETYIHCGMFEALKEDIQQYSDEEGYELYFEAIDDELKQNPAS